MVEGYEVTVTLAVREGDASGELVARTRCNEFDAANSIYRGLSTLYGDGYTVTVWSDGYYVYSTRTPRRVSWQALAKVVGYRFPTP